MSGKCIVCGDSITDLYCSRCHFMYSGLAGGASRDGEIQRANMYRQDVLSDICVDVILKQYDGSRFVDKAYRIADKGRLASGEECRLNGDFGACAAADWQLVVNDNGDAYKVSEKMPAMTESEFVHISLKPVPDTLQATLIIRNNSRQAESSPFFLRRKAR